MNMWTRKFRLVGSTLALLVSWTIMQHGPIILGKVARYPVEFLAKAPHSFVADMSQLPKGKYFVSAGRTSKDTEIYLNGNLLQRGQLTTGAAVDLSDNQPPKVISIDWVAQKEWRKRVLDQPVVTAYSVGILIQVWQFFNGIFLGPVFSLLLVLFAMFNLKVSKNNSSQIMPHLICGMVGIVYGLFLSGLPDLLFDPSINPPIQVALRISLSAAVVYLIFSYLEFGTKQKSFRVLLSLHAIGVVLAFALYAAGNNWFVKLYEIELYFFGAATLIPSILLIKAKKQNSEIELVVCIGLALTVIEAFCGILYTFLGASAWMVWSPTLIAILAVANFYFIYKKAVAHSAEIQFSKQQYLLVAQIAHDIRAPLASLGAVIHHSESLDESARHQIKGVVSRIRDIANNLLSGDRSRKLYEAEEGISEASVVSTELKSVELLGPQLSSIVSEKRLQYLPRKDLEITFNEESLKLPLFANVQRIELGRIISNLIDNSIEAMKGRGRILVDLKVVKDRIQIIINDNGMGMSTDVLQKIGTRGFTQGKCRTESGSGLGVCHAMETVRAWEGELRYESQVAIGTKAIITIPKAKAPAWFPEKISIKSNATVIVLDDDLSMHEIWRAKFRCFGEWRIKIASFTTSNDMIKWYRENLGEVENPLYLCDYELGGNDHTGLDVIEMLGIAEEAILVTHRWDDIEIRARCLKLGVKLTPKDVQVAIIESA